MELTLGLAQADVAKLPRLPAFRAARTGRARGQAVRTIWHDSLDRTLAARGLALAEQRGTWRLERHRPSATELWPPATDHILIAEGPDPNRLGEDLPDPIVAVAAFEGRRNVTPLSFEGETVSVTLLDGVLRAVVAERRVARLILSGPDHVVSALARSLAGMLVLTVPDESLAMAAARLADGSPGVPRRHGIPMLPERGFTVAEAFAHIMGHLTDVIVTLAPLVGDPETGVEPVHQMRVAVRRTRSALALFRAVITHPGQNNPDYQRISDGMRNLGHMLGPARDWDVFMTETAPPVAAVLGDQPGLSALLKAAARRRTAARAALCAWLASPDFRLLTIDLACLVAAAPAGAEEPPLPVFAAGVLGANWKRLQKASRSLKNLDAPALHDMRLKAKRLRYAAEFFSALFPEKPTARFVERLASLQERLGVFNDTAAAADLLRDLNGGSGHAGGLVLGFTAARGAGIHPKIAAAWDRLRQREAFWL